VEDQAADHLINGDFGKFTEVADNATLRALQELLPDYPLSAQKSEPAASCNAPHESILR
jgi:hypothetical protein